MPTVALRYRLLFVAPLLALACVVSARAADFSSLSNWVGSYPVRDAQGKHENILDDPRLRSAINALLDPVDIKKLRSFDESTPVRDVDDFIVINKCKAHNCAPDRAMLVLDTKHYRLWIGFFARYQSRVVVRWYGNVDPYSLLPSEILKDFSDQR